MKNKELSYSEALAQIEEILARLNGQDQDIDTLAAEVKRATELIAFCKQRLRKTEEDVQKILEE